MPRREPRRSYSEIVKAFQDDRTHIVHHSMRLRHKKTIRYEERQSCLNLAERYVARMDAECKMQLSSMIIRRQILTDRSGLAAAWSTQYERLAQIFANILGKKNWKVAEIGCGSGALTIPLAKHLVNAQFVLVDRFVGCVHWQNYKALVSNLKRAKLVGRARIVVSDYLKWIAIQGDKTYDAVISSEFLPEIDSAGTRQFVRECYRLLRPKGIVVHSFLSPVPRNIRQKLLITADSNPAWTNTPPKEWFSPKPELVIRELRESGFHRIRRKVIRSNLVIKGDAARSQLKRWQIKDSFFNAHEKLLNTRGFEIPDWVIISALKS
jgi:2-polyprenyl-3-methyl-5-hydroxy-6-metoxy-1,4-benzoquinol methylase